VPGDHAHAHDPGPEADRGDEGEAHGYMRSHTRRLILVRAAADEEVIDDNGRRRHADPMSELSGMGMYVRSLSAKTHGTPQEMAAKAVKNGLDFVAILAAWQQPDKTGQIVTSTKNLSSIKKYAYALMASGVRVTVWGYPWSGHEQDFVRSMARVYREANLTEFPLIDPELGYKWKIKQGHAKEHGVRGAKEAIGGLDATGTKVTQTAHAYQLKQKLVEVFGGFGTTSYGIPEFHPNFPWEDFLVGSSYRSPQFYSPGADVIIGGYRDWLRISKRVTMMPSFATFGQNSGGQLHGRLSLLLHPEARPGVNPVISGLVGWSWRQTSEEEWEAIRYWSERMRRERRSGWPKPRNVC